METQEQAANKSPTPNQTPVNAASPNPHDRTNVSLEAQFLDPCFPSPM